MRTGAGTCAFLLLLLLLASAVPVFPAAPIGIPRSLALERARQIANLRYHLAFEIQHHVDSALGHEDLQFDLKKSGSVLVDFRDGSVSAAKLNGVSISTTLDNGHLLLPDTALRDGANHLSLEFRAPVAPAGKAIIRYQDKDDGSEYIYTLFVPMDASMAFPCFDQPDLKGRFTLDIVAPSGWTIISNTMPRSSETLGSRVKTRFGETQPISTYLFAFAAGPFKEIHSAAGLPRVYVRRSQVARAEPEIPAIQSVTAGGLQFLQDYFAQPFPFPKYEMVLIPDFAYGGMEHAGATFLREDSMLFRSAPTETDRFNRSVTVLHELAHQWFGDLVTMRWFDDLWLKEGFAQYMAYRTLSALQPQQNVWKRFYQAIKPAAYGIDVTQGTTPVYQDIPNLSDAKSAYGAIVYSKAPGLLRQLAYMLGDVDFRNGLRLYLKEHAYGNAEWNDLVRALEKSSRVDLTEWAQDWIHRRGMPEVQTEWSCDSEHRLRRLALTQTNVLGEGGTWPLASEVLLGYAHSKPIRVGTRLTAARVEVAEAEGKACPDYVFANNDDYAYGLFLLDQRSLHFAVSHLADVSDLFERTLLWGAFWDAVRFEELAPSEYLALLLHRMPTETDESLLQSLGGSAAVGLHNYVGAELRERLDPRFEEISRTGAVHSSTQGLRIVWFRTLRNVADDPAGLASLKALLNGSLAIPDVKLRQMDRWSLVTSLIAHHDHDAEAVFEAEKQRDRTGEALKFSYVAAAAKPDKATKEWYFHDYLTDTARPEDWVQESLGAFNFWNQSELTEPYLRPALDALPQVKQQRKIFFVLAWLSAFIYGQNSEKADAEVHRWLSSASLDPDLRLKVLQIVDGLDRTVRIRHRYP